jgi:phenylpropionate dioxygenase-like ring-hydroxylating dioxygenase large terminal subunit
MASRKRKTPAAPVLNGHANGHAAPKLSRPKSKPSLTDFTHPVCPARRIKTEKPFRFHLAGVAYVLWRDRAGAYHCVEDECPHRRASLACGRVVDDAIYCPYHRWKLTGDGVCTSPSDADVRIQTPEYRVFEHLGYLWMSRRDAPEAALASLMPEKPGWSFAGTARVTMQAPLEIVLDNFSENEHVPWVHSGLGWDEARLSSIDFDFQKTEKGARVSYRARQRPNLLFRLLLVGTDDIYVNEFDSEFEPLRVTYNISWEKKQGAGKRPLSTASTVYFVPETADRTTLHFFFQYKLTELRFLEPLVKRSIPFLAVKEAIDDKRFLESVMADAPADLQGMKLRRFDKPIALHRKLLHERYLRGQTLVPNAAAAPVAGRRTVAKSR